MATKKTTATPAEAVETVEPITETVIETTEPSPVEAAASEVESVPEIYPCRKRLTNNSPLTMVFPELKIVHATGQANLVLRGNTQVSSYPNTVVYTFTDADQFERFTADVNAYAEHYGFTDAVQIETATKD